MQNPPIRVALVEDRYEIRDGLREMISGSDGFECCGAYGSMEDALPALGDASPHVALIDIGLPGMSGVEGIREIRLKHPAIRLLVLSIYNDDERVFNAICAGACGYLLKKTPPARLLESIREVVAGGAPMSPEIANRVLALFRENAPPQQADYNLTPHELRLLRLLVEGHNYKTMSALLGVTVHAVSFHMRNIYEKLEVHSKSEAVGKALRQHLLD
jgi:DNA-binding NarL/FixJ family response regulator